MSNMLSIGIPGDDCRVYSASSCFTVGELALTFGMKAKTIRKMIKDGSIETVRDRSGHVLITVPEYHRLIEADVFRKVRGKQ